MYVASEFIIIIPPNDLGITDEFDPNGDKETSIFIYLKFFFFIIKELMSPGFK